MIDRTLKQAWFSSLTNKSRWPLLIDVAHHKNECSLLSVIRFRYQAPHIRRPRVVSSTVNRTIGFTAYSASVYALCRSINSRIVETCGNVCVRTANRRIFGLDGIDDFMTWRCFRHTYGHTVTMTGAALAYLSKPYYRR